ncbi:LON peptidase substrate-binding domain-containing protein [Oceanobacter mangrovi]|uniref:LON peptidase substrate-binding domain-containing protein n=1 Tax=Oceanobacter mangrovi TaxID=2862510 RepID=UPI001C8D15E0|nr:LON peptidase substrate-binding domain-containing protein [Oceanobacter mangrovi]
MTTEICMFPIPECVTFPGTVFPLHVFEPRYRQMIQHCLDTNALVAICHTEKVVSLGKPNDNLKEALKSNQATYKPYPVFSAGLCELIETTPDGRLYLNVHIEQRFKAVAEKQTLPFMVYECEPFEDRPATDDETELAAQLMEKILVRLQALAQNEPAMQQTFAPARWQDKTPQQFSFELFGSLSFGAENQQQLLEMDSAAERLAFVLEMLNQIEHPA